MNMIANENYNRLSDFYYDNDGDSEDDGNGFIGVEILFEDYQFSYEGQDYSVDGVATLEGSMIAVYLEVVAVDVNDNWELVNTASLHKELAEYLEESNEFREYIEELASI